MALTAAFGHRARALGVVALALISTPAAGGLRNTYDAALAAMEAGQWPAAERLFRESLVLRPTEARRLPLKRIFRPYLPHYYLGAVLARQGDCRGALSEWRLSDEQEVIDEIGLGGELGLRRSACEERLAELERLRVATESALDEATGKADRLADPGLAQLMRLGFEGGLGSLGRRLQAARERISEARTRFERAGATEDLELARAAYRDAEETSRELGGALEELDGIARRVADERARKADRGEKVRELAQRVEELLRSRSQLPSAVRARRQELGSLLAIAFALPESATLEQLDGLERRLQAFLEQLERSEAPPPGALRSGAIAYLRADYRTVLERLAEIPSGDGKTRAHCLLLRSAAAYALHLAGGESDVELLTRAREDVLAARRSAPDLVPAGSAFSPRFVRFFEAVTAAVPGA